MLSNQHSQSYHNYCKTTATSTVRLRQRICFTVYKLYKLFYYYYVILCVRERREQYNPKNKNIFPLFFFSFFNFQFIIYKLFFSCLFDTQTHLWYVCKNFRTKQKTSHLVSKLVCTTGFSFVCNTNSLTLTVTCLHWFGRLFHCN